MATKGPDPINSLAEATGVRLGQLDQSIKQMDARLTQRLDTLAGKMDTFLEALNRMERGINRMATSWDSQLKLLETIISNQQQMVATQAKTVDRLLDLAYPKEAS